ncbi:MAG TPA: SH3 domain-containing protein [Aggregatilineaceae bacterium]|nr:SH3 domain-containing protein [Aggregatilineaceae bacterium]
MRRFASLVLLMVLLLTPFSPGRAQGQSLVVFVQDDSLGTTGDWGVDGTAKFKGIFESLGARVETITLDDPIPPDADVVVITQPTRTLPILFLAHLWVHLQQGHHLLLTVNPLGQEKTRNEKSGDGFPKLLNQDYGLVFTDAFAAEPWFTPDKIMLAETSFSRVYADSVPHPIVEPLARYQVPVYIWGARTLMIDAIGLNANAVPLLASRTAYGETGKVFDPTEPRVPLEITPGEDLIGLQNLGGASESIVTGSRVVVLGDSQMVQNDYGLIFAPQSVDALYPGNQILLERIAAWLLELPDDQWPPLPTGYTWLAIDGKTDDWENRGAITADAAGDGNGGADITQVRAFQNQDFLYLLVESTSGAPTSLQLTFDTNNDGSSDGTLLVDAAGAIAGERMVPDVRAVFGENTIELQIPLREAGTVLDLCSGEDEQRDCLDGGLEISTVNEAAPTDLLFPEGPLVMVRTDPQNNVNLRSGPGTTSETLGRYENGQVFLAIGRDATGEWIQVQNARHTGWLAQFLLRSNVDLMTLPVVSAE